MAPTTIECSAAYPNQPEWLERPARKQVDDSTLQRELALQQSKGGDTNLWSGRKQLGQQRDKSAPRVKEASRYRCVPLLDVGRTRGSDAHQHTFCLYYAKGCCSQGSICPYLHRLPTLADEEYHRKDLGADCFGREKRGEQEGFHSQAGTLSRDNRTLYVNYEGAGTLELPALRKLLEDNFRPWGIVDNIYIVHHKTLAFVRYEWRSAAEVAKEAMHKQHLLGSRLSEVLTVRWSNEDPNPASMVQAKRAAEHAFADAYWETWETLPPEEKTRRIQKLQMHAALKKGKVISDYPDTDAQFGAQPAVGGFSGGSLQAGVGAAAYPDTDAQYPGAFDASACRPEAGGIEAGSSVCWGGQLGGDQQGGGGATGAGSSGQEPGSTPDGADVGMDAHYAAWHAYYAQQQQVGGQHAYYPGQHDAQQAGYPGSYTWEPGHGQQGPGQQQQGNMQGLHADAGRQGTISDRDGGAADLTHGSGEGLGGLLAGYGSDDSQEDEGSGKEKAEGGGAASAEAT